MKAKIIYRINSLYKTRKNKKMMFYDMENNTNRKYHRKENYYGNSFGQRSWKHRCKKKHQWMKHDKTMFEEAYIRNALKEYIVVISELLHMNWYSFYWCETPDFDFDKLTRIISMEKL